MSELSGAEHREQPSDSRVVLLGYLGDPGGFCQPVVVNFEGTPHYVLHKCYLSSEGRPLGDYVGVHKKIEYPTQEALEEAFGEIMRQLTIPPTIDGWVATDSSLGFDVSREELYAASNKLFETYGY